ncbi:MAG: hypothetical protein IPO86_10125 [Saprospiraceae bacterium]|nr:hypothetical protein [Saprospiraceae bacterium]
MVEILIFVEQTQPNINPVDNSWTQRHLTFLGIPPVNPFVRLQGFNLVFPFQGSYLISGSAPAYKTGEHKLCLREARSPKLIKILGTSEFSSAIPNDELSLGIVTRSFILGTIVIDNTNLNLALSLDHWIHNNTGGANAFGLPSKIPNTRDIFAQIMIQKID